MTIDIDALRAVVGGAHQSHRIPGLAVAVIGPDGARWSEGFGLAEVENAVPATPDTIWRLGSIAKPVTAVAVLQLVERGLLELDAPIQRYVPAFPQKPWPVTVRQLLAHLGGVRDFDETELQNSVHYPCGATPQTAFLDRFAADPLLHEPGTRFRYTTHGYTLLGCAIEAVSGVDYLRYVRERISPHLMADDVRAIIPHRARGYTRADDGIVRNAALTDPSDHLPGGGLCGSAVAAALFGADLLAGRLLRASTLELAFTRERTTSGQDTRYGLGWFVWSRGGGIEAAHGGKHHGASTMLYVSARTGISVAVLTNLQEVASPSLHSLAQRLGDIAYSSSEVKT